MKRWKMVVVLWLAVVFPGILWAAPGIKITSPENRSVVKSGDEVAVTVEAVDGFVLEEGFILFSGGGIYNENLRSLPATRTFKVSRKAIGTVGVLVVAKDAKGAQVSDQIILLAEPAVALRSLVLRPGGVSFHLDWAGELDRTWDDFEYVGVDGVFADGQTRSVNEFATFSTSDPSIVSVDQEGKFTVHRPGDVKAYVSCLGITQEVPVAFIKPRGLKPSETGRPVTALEMDPLPNAAGWHKSDVKVTLTARDNEGGSGIKEIHYFTGALPGMQIVKGDTAVIYVSQEGGEEVLSFSSMDRETNFEYSQKVVFKIDKTPPEVKIDAPAEGAEYILRAPVVTSWSAIDALSGLDSVVGSAASGAALNTSVVGPQTLSVTATDKAGNKTTATRAYHVRYIYGGVLPPIDQDNSSLFKLGRVVPVKFQLRDALGGFISTAVARIYLSKVSDQAAGEEVEAVSPGQANTGNLFRYDSSSQQYIFNLGTKSLSAGTWKIRIDLDDSTSKQATIALK
jgi:hypothetical protein